jgi:hypothetical protein
MRYAFCILITFAKTVYAQDIQSRLRFEIAGFANVDFNYFNKSTFTTTSEQFAISTALGGMYSKYERKGLGLGEGDKVYNFEYSFTAIYELNPKWDLRMGVLSASAGSFGNPGTYFLGGSSGSSTRVFKLYAVPTWQFWYNTNHRTGANLGVGASLDFVRKDVHLVTSYTTISGNDTIRFADDFSFRNSLGISIMSAAQFYFKLENNNRLTINLVYSLGLTPLVASQYRYGINQQNYYTELLSNGSFIRLGIGYEFQLFKKRFGYRTKEKLTGKNGYIYK